MSLTNRTTTVMVNSSLNAMCGPLAEESNYVKMLKALACCVIMLVSLLGNTAVVAVVARNKSMWTTTNYLIANMAASDLLVSIFAMPREFTEIFAGARRWMVGGLAGLALCKIVYFFQDISVAVSLQSLVVIAIDRYRGVVFPFRPAIITAKLCKFIIPLSWIVAMVMHGTYFYTARLEMRNNRTYCTFSWSPAFDNRSAQELYFTVVSVVLVMLPLCIILTLYALLIRELKNRKTKNSASELRRQRHKENSKIVKKIVAIVVLFLLCITPITIVGILYYFVWDWKMPCRMENLIITTKFIFYSNAALNPCVYFLLNERYRKGLDRILTSLRSSSRLVQNDIELKFL